MNANGQLLTEDGPLTYDTVTYGYNDGRVRQSLAVQYANNNSWSQTYPNSYVRYAYDPAGQLTWAKATNSSGHGQLGGARIRRALISDRTLLRAGCPRTGRRASDGAWRSAAGSAAATFDGQAVAVGDRSLLTRCPRRDHGRDGKLGRQRRGAGEVPCGLCIPWSVARSPGKGTDTAETGAVVSGRVRCRRWTLESAGGIGGLLARRSGNPSVIEPNGST